MSEGFCVSVAIGTCTSLEHASVERKDEAKKNRSIIDGSNEFLGTQATG